MPILVSRDEVRHLSPTKLDMNTEESYLGGLSFDQGVESYRDGSVVQKGSRPTSNRRIN